MFTFCLTFTFYDSILENMKQKLNKNRESFDPFTDDVFSYPSELKKEKWSVSWSDLMMTMFIFFVVMYVYQAGNRELKFGPGPGDNYLSDTGSDKIVDTNIKKKPSDIYDQTKKNIQDAFVDDTTAVDLVKDRSVRITIAGDFLFDIGKAELKTQAQWSIRQVAQIIRENSFIVNVIGHTDSTPNYSDKYPTNWELSAARACNVARYLIEECGIAGERFFVSGHAWHQPVKPNNTSYSRSLNRRVEIILMKEKPYSEKQASVNSTN